VDKAGVPSFAVFAEDAYLCRPCGTWFLFCELTPGLRPGLMNAAPFDFAQGRL